jgi:phospholipase C
MLRYGRTMRIKFLSAFCLMSAPAWAQTQLQRAQTAIQHVIVIMQENRSFDHYFGTFPGADGLALDANGQPTACYPSGVAGVPCIKPFHDRHGINAGSRHRSDAAITDIDGGKMDGYLIVLHTNTYVNNCYPTTVLDVGCAAIELGFRRSDAVGYHTADEIPNYWAYASHFMLQDHMFEPVASYSLPSHLYMTSGWSAKCTSKTNPLTCTTWLAPPINSTVYGAFAWSDLTDLLDRAGVSWKYYIEQGEEPDCADGQMTCPPEKQQATVYGFWNPLAGFGEVIAKNKASPGYLAQHNPPLEQFYADLQAGTLPQVSWIVPSQLESEHPPGEIQRGMTYVTALLNAIQQSSAWNNTAVFLSWDDWGGFLEHEVPPVADQLSTGAPIGYGLRVPGIVISPWVKAGTIDHQVLSFDAYLKFTEDLFLGGERIGGPHGARPDSRPTIRESLTKLAPGPGAGTASVPVGDLLNDFDFTQTPVAPLMLPTLIPLDFEPTFHADYTTHYPLHWSAVITGPVRTYTVYRTTTSGSGYEPVPGCSPTSKTVFLATSCTDKAVVAGTPYHYVITSTDPNGVESPRSTEVDVTPADE